jgi:HD-GYP domain-containing protein (c-di-GMP phosphodiesterase class II)
MKGYFLIKEQEYIDKIDDGKNQSILKLKGENIEIIHFNLNKDRVFIIHPYECKDAMLTFFILEGSMINQDDKEILCKGDMVYVKDIEEAIIYNVIEDMKIIQLNQSNIFMQHSKYMDEVGKIMDLIDKKDHYTKDHCNRTGNLCGRLGIILGIEGKNLNDLILAAKVHDIGKIDIPIEILNKNNILNDEEYFLIKEHSVLGYDILKGQLEDIQLRMILEHHEKLNGSGYPKGLKEESIAFESRIIAVADAYDAMTTTRPYRAAMEPKIAYSILEKDSGILWDKKVIDALFLILRSDGLI